LCTIPALVLLAYLTFYLGYIQGQEFSPDTFHRREFSYYELPVFGLQVWPISRADCTGPLERFLEDKKLIAAKADKAVEVRWDLVFSQRGVGTSSRRLAHSDAQILCYYLDAEDAAGTSVWLKWSEDHGEQARVLWPAVARIARQQLYLFAPDLMCLTHDNPTAAELQTRIAATLAQKYCLLAQTHHALGRHATAVELYDEALAHRPQWTAAIEGRNKSREALGQIPQSP
jgi:hypothetical protein